MKAIAEYFRDLAADDRYFGAEPPQPDADMLARIAEREIARRVEARAENGAVHLRAATLAAPVPAAPVAQPAVSPTPVAAEPEVAVTAPVSAPAAAPAAAAAIAGVMVDQSAFEEDEDAAEVVAPAVAPAESVADKLSRIRAVVARQEAEPAASDYSEDEHSSDFLDEAARDIEQMMRVEDGPEQTATESLRLRRAPEPFDTVEEIEEAEADEAPARSSLRLDPALFADQDEDDAEPAKLRLDPELYDEEDSAADETASDAEEEAPQRSTLRLDPALFADVDDDIEDEAEMAAADPAPAAPVRARVLRMKRSQFNDAVARGLIEEADDESSLSEEDEADLMRELAEVEAEFSGTSAEAAHEAWDEDDGFDDEDDYADEGHAEEGYEEDAYEDAPAEAFDEDEDDRAEFGNAQAMQDDALEDDDLEDDDFEDEDLEDEDDGYETVAEGYEHAFEPVDAEDEDEDDRALAAIHPRHRELSPIDEDALVRNLGDKMGAPGHDEDDAPAPAPREEGIGASIRSLARRTVKLGSEGRTMLTQRPAADDESVSRLMNETRAHMAEPDAQGRRNAIQHLRAAVAATKAEKEATRDRPQRDSSEAYRDDLAEVVRPRRPVSGDGRSERPRTDVRPAPLKLVAEQRIDVPRAEPVRPRRVDAVAAAPRAAEDAGGFAEFAEEMGATSLSQLLEAAAAYMSFVEGRDEFSRPQLMTKVRQLEGEEFSREDGLRSFGQLLRQGKIEKIRGGRFTVSDQIGYRPDARAAG